MSSSVSSCMEWLKDSKNVLKLILIAIVVILLIYIIIQIIGNSGNQVRIAKDSISSREELVLTEIPASIEGVQATYSLWFYINNWDYRYGEQKTLFTHGDFLTSYFDKENSDLVISFKTKNGPKEQDLILTNINVQKWINLTITYNNRLVVIYKNGEIVASKKLLGIPDASFNTINITPKGGFSGLIWNFQYYNKALSKRRIVKKIYNKGKAGSPQGFLGWWWWFYLNLNINQPDV